MSGIADMISGRAVLAAVALVGALAAGYGFAKLWLLRKSRRQRQAKALESLREALASESAESQPGDWMRARTGVRSLGLDYAVQLNRRLYAGRTSAVSPSVRAGRAEKTRAGRLFLEQARAAGLSAYVGVAAFCEARTRLAFLGAAAGALVGAVFSTELAVGLGVAAALAARSLPMRGVRDAVAERRVDAQRHLSEMLEVVALGLRSGLTFDRSFALYGSHFDSGFARSCAVAQRRWALGLTTREEALHDLAAAYDCEQLARVVETMVRSLRFGTALTGTLSEAAVQARAGYQTALAERVAKAPVKMMVPTGTLILPAMLLLVMGPILLELLGGF